MSSKGGSAKGKAWRRPRKAMLPAKRARSPGRYDPARAADAVGIIETLPHIKGRWAGSTLTLEPWQRAVIEDVFGTLNRDGTRQYRTVYIEIPRKNGKTTLAAAVALYLLFADNEPGAEVYSAAYDRDQACIAFDLAAEMVKRVPELRNRCRIVDYKKRITHRNGSFYRAVEREHIGQHGFNAHGIIFDELHTQKTPELWDVLTTSTGSRAQPVTFAITTAGYDRESICWRLHDYSRKILAGTIESPTFYPVIFSADPADRAEAEIDWTDRRLWRQANPGLRSGIVSMAELGAKAEEAQEIPEQQNTFKRLRLNIWTQAESRLIDGAQWRRCEGGRKKDSLAGLSAFCGLDLASTQDIAAAAFAVPVDGEVHTLFRYWCPKDAIMKRSRDDGVPYDLWIEQGYMTATPGSAIDFDYIEAEILGLSKELNIQRAGYDRWQAVQLAQHLEAEGLETAPIGQGFAGISEATKEFVRLVVSGRLRHTGDPVTRWMIDNLVAETDAAGNLKPSKKKSTEKIDGCVALIMAIDCMIRTEQEPESVYESRGLITV